MVKGLNIFRDHLSAYSESFVLIGGAACDDWFTSQNLQFRATNYLDIVLVMEKLDAGAIAAFRSFIAAGDYQEIQRSEEKPVLYRFTKPTMPDFPVMLELFGRENTLLDLAPGQRIIPVKINEESHSLSAILLDDDYYALLRENQSTSNGLPFATATSLIPLKAKAWLDLSQRSNDGERIDSKDIKKHRSDVFRLAATLPAEPGPELPESIRDDLAEFLAHFPADSPDWQAISAALKTTFGSAASSLKPEALLETLYTYFRL